MSTTTVRHPNVLWAQRSGLLYLTIDVQDCKDPEVHVTNDSEKKSGRVVFKGKAHSHATGPEEHEYELDLELFDEINPEEGPFWPRLLKASGKAPLYVKADWDKWVDEDEEEEASDLMSGFDMSALQSLGGGGGGGAGGAGGFDLSQLGDMAGKIEGEDDDSEEEEDNDEPPPLQKE
eukprot:jgi/Picre1/28197/NNA_003603.t1